MMVNQDGSGGHHEHAPAHTEGGGQLQRRAMPGDPRDERTADTGRTGLSAMGLPEGETVVLVPRELLDQYAAGR
jgi:hypothetical protein